MTARTAPVARSARFPGAATERTAGPGVDQLTAQLVESGFMAHQCRGRCLREATGHVSRSILADQSPRSRYVSRRRSTAGLR